MKTDDVKFGLLSWFGVDKGNSSIYGPCCFELDFKKSYMLTRGAEEKNKETFVTKLVEHWSIPKRLLT